MSISLARYTRRGLLGVLGVLGVLVVPALTSCTLSAWRIWISGP
jgi:hypothetical protein